MKRIFALSALCLSVLAAGAQNGVCLKYAGTSNGMTNDTLQVFSLNGDSYTQVTKVLGGMVSYKSLKLKSRPESGFNIFPDNTYRMIPDVQLKEYNVKVIGKEKMAGYNCTKITLSTFANGAESTMWITNELPDYKNYLDVVIVDFKVERINEALKKFNVTGIPVKIAYNVQGNLSYELVKASSCPVNPDLLNIDKYTNSKPATANPEKQ